LEFVQDPANPSVQYVVEQGGKIRVIQNGILLSTPFLDISSSITAGGEQGLLGLAFPSDYGTSGRFYVDFTDKVAVGNTVVARFKRSALNPLVADVSTRFDLRWSSATGPRSIVQPFANHNGGHLAFGPDNYLYVALGDGGSGDDPQNNSQNPMSFLGKLLRIDVNVLDTHPQGYLVPSDNPFVDNLPIPALHEIWAFGVRNPWKFTFDNPALGGTGAMLIGDVGQGSWEEVDYQPPGVGGRNYGWRIREGAHAHIATKPPAYLPLIEPITEYDHSVGNSITGGVVYRGMAMGPTYRGRYFYADFVVGRIWSVALMAGVGSEVTASAPVEHTAELGGSSQIGNVSAFGVDAAGEMYLVSYGAGTILKVSALRYPLTVSVQGSGTVTSGDAAIGCPSACSQLYASGTVVALIATPATGFVFGGWSSSDCSSGTVVMNAAHSCTATFLVRNSASSTPGSVSLSGSGFGDVLTFNPRTGARTEQLSDGQNHFGELRGGWSLNWEVYAADFNDDGLTDFFLYNRTTGQWYKATNDGAGGFTYFTGQWSVGWQVFIVDLNGDGRSDVFVSNPQTGDWYRAVSTGIGTTAFSYVAGHWTPGWRIYPGALNGDLFADFFLHDPATGYWYQVINDGMSGFTYTFGQWRTGWDITPGDFDGDGRTDFFLSQPTTGEWYVATTQPGGFAYGHGVWSVGWTFSVGDFDGDGKADLFLYNPMQGWWYEAVSDGHGQFGLTFGTFSPNWQVRVSDFNGDGHCDLLLYNSTTGQWYQAVNAAIGSFTYGTGFWEPDLTVVSSLRRIP
jgi:glucose/arabinose dehydrogenase